MHYTIYTWAPGGGQDGAFAPLPPGIQIEF